MWTVGVIGLGSFGQKRVQALLDLHDLVEQVIVYDKDRRKTDHVISTFPSKKVKLTSVRKIDQIFDDPKIDVVLICTPNSTHSELCQLALSHHKHVLCEKPITHSLKIAKQLISLAKKNSRILKPGTNHRFFPSVQKLLSLVNEEQLGEVLSFHGSIGNDGQRIQDSWFWQKDLATGGTFLDNGYHLVDLAVQICGSFAECFGHASKRVWKKSEVEDYALAVYRQPSFQKKAGYEAVLRSSWRQPHGYMEVEVWGTKGSAKVSIGDQETLSWKNTNGKDEINFSEYPKTSLQQSLKYFFSLCSEPEKNLFRLSTELLQTTGMIEAFYRSEQKQKWVKVKK